MSQIVQVQIGQAGNKIGYQFWNQIIKQHHLNENGQSIGQFKDHPGNISALFQQQQIGLYKPRNICADISFSSMQQLVASPLRNLFRIEDCVYDSVSASSYNLWPVGYSCKQKPFLEHFMDSIRYQVQKCDRFGGFNVLHSICGGTGSGMGSLILQRLDQTYAKSIITQFCVLPSPKLSDIIVQPYNATLSLNVMSSLISNPSILFDNQALFRNKIKHIQNKIYTFEDVNKKIGNCLSDLTAPFRFPCDGNINFRKMAQNLMSYPGFKFLTMSIPFEFDEKSKINQIVYNLYDPFNSSVSLQIDKRKKHKWLTNYYIFRGECWKSFDINYRLAKYFQTKIKVTYTFRIFKDVYFRNYLPHHFITATLPQNSRTNTNSVTSLQNGSVIKQIFEQISQTICKMLRKKSYLHWYIKQGMELQDFNEAQMSLNDRMSQYSCINQIVQEYNQHQDYYEQ